MTIREHFRWEYGKRYFYNPHDVSVVIDYDTYVTVYLDPSDQFVTDADKTFLPDRLNDDVVPLHKDRM